MPETDPYYVGIVAARRPGDTGEAFMQHVEHVVGRVIKAVGGQDAFRRSFPQTPRGTVDILAHEARISVDSKDLGEAAILLASAVFQEQGYRVVVVTSPEATTQITLRRPLPVTIALVRGTIS